MTKRKTKTPQASGAQLRALLEKHELRGNKGAQIAATLLHVEPLTIQQYLSRGMRLNDLELLQYKLADRK